MKVEAPPWRWFRAGDLLATKRIAAIGPKRNGATEMSSHPDIVTSSFGTTGSAVIPVTDDGGGRRWAIIGLLSLAMIIAYLSRSNLVVALMMPDFIKSSQLSDTDRGTLNSAFSWAYTALQIPAGCVLSYLFTVTERYAPEVEA